MSTRFCSCALLVFASLANCCALGEDDGFEVLFDGSSLDGWKHSGKLGRGR